MIDKKHWYDGIIYDKFVAPNQDLMFRIIKHLINKNTSVVDIGCGTGRLEFQLAERCNKVTGIDLSSKNIKVAKRNLGKMKFDNIDFIHSSVEKFAETVKVKFNYAIMTFVIHEIAPEQRIMILSAMKKVADTIIIGDYLVPRKDNLATKFSIAVEYFAGKDHFTNYKSFVKQGGLKPLLKEAGLTVIEEINGKPVISQIVKAV